MKSKSGILPPHPLGVGECEGRRGEGGGGWGGDDTFPPFSFADAEDGPKTRVPFIVLPSARPQGEDSIYSPGFNSTERRGEICMFGLNTFLHSSPSDGLYRM